MDRKFSSLDETAQFSREKTTVDTVQEIIASVYIALKERGYNPIDQLVGYIMSGDPTYITSHNNARYMIRKLERDEILEEIVLCYIKQLESDGNKQ